MRLAKYHVAKTDIPAETTEAIIVTITPDSITIIASKNANLVWVSRSTRRTLSLPATRRFSEALGTEDAPQDARDPSTRRHSACFDRSQSTDGSSTTIVTGDVTPSTVSPVSVLPLHSTIKRFGAPDALRRIVGVPCAAIR